MNIRLSRVAFAVLLILGLYTGFSATAQDEDSLRATLAHATTPVERGLTLAKLSFYSCFSKAGQRTLSGKPVDRHSRCA